MSSQFIQRLPGHPAPLQQPLAGLRTVALSRLLRAGRTLLAHFSAHTQQQADAEFLARAERYAATYPKLARELRSYARGGSSY